MLVQTTIATSSAAQCELDTLVASDASSSAAFGAALSLDGDLALVGAPQQDGKGAAYVFERTSLGWMQVAKLTASDGASGDLFGAAAVPFQGGFLCVQPPVVRTAGQDAGGQAACTGACQVDFDAYVLLGIDAGARPRRHGARPVLVPRPGRPAQRGGALRRDRVRALPVIAPRRAPGA
jgi:hypothetical protein